MKTFKQILAEVKQLSLPFGDETPRKPKQLSLPLGDKTPTKKHAATVKKPNEEYEHSLVKHLNHLIGQHNKAEHERTVLQPTGSIVDDHAREDAKKIYDIHKDRIVQGMKAIHTGKSQKAIAEAMSGKVKKYTKDDVESSADIVLKHPNHDDDPEKNRHIGIQAKYAESTPSLRKLELGSTLGLLRSGIFTRSSTNKEELPSKEELKGRRTRLFNKISPVIKSKLKAGLSFGRGSPQFKSARAPVRDRLLNFITRSFNRLPNLDKKKRALKKMTRSLPTPGMDEVTVRRFGRGKSRSEVYDHHAMWNKTLDEHNHNIEAVRSGGGIRFIGKNHPTDQGSHLATYTPNTASTGDRELGDVKETVAVHKNKKVYA